MNTLIITPLFPPDTAFSAQYAKELAARLASEHQVTILLYGHLPEHIPGVEYVCVDKRIWTPKKLWRLFWHLLAASKKHEAVYILNGPSVELPALLVSLVTRKKFILIMSDLGAYLRSHSHWLHRHILVRLENRSKSIIRLEETAAGTEALERPEIHPLCEYPTGAFETYESAWKKHLEEIAIPTS